MNRNTRKHEVAFKVKEIKQRQQNWLKQRAEYQQSDREESYTSTDSAHNAAPSYTEKKTEKQKEAVGQSGNLGNLLASKKSKAKFENWLKAKHTEDEHESDGSHDGLYDPRDKKYDSSNYRDSNYGNNLYRDEAYRDHQGSKEVNVLRIPSSRSAEYATPDPSWNSEDETGEITAAQLLSPEDFDAVADSIINRVKGDLGYKNKEKSSPRTASTNGKSTLHEHYGKTRDNKSRDSITSTKTAKVTSGKANHVCPSCDKLMVPPSNSPMLLVPCGHTLCGQCSRRTKFCGMCGSRVESVTANVMLEQIITNYNSNQSEYKAFETSANTTNDILKYREEFQNLQTREDILQEESDNIDRRIIKISQELSVQNQQVDNIQAQEEKVSAEINSLQEKLHTLQTHRQEYEHSCDKLQRDYKQEKNRLLMIKESIDSIRTQKEKIKLLAEDEY